MKWTTKLSLAMAAAVLIVPTLTFAGSDDQFDRYRYRYEARREARDAMRDARRAIAEARREALRARLAWRNEYRHAYRDAFREAQQRVREAVRESRLESLAGGHPNRAGRSDCGHAVWLDHSAAPDRPA